MPDFIRMPDASVIDVMSTMIATAFWIAFGIAVLARVLIAVARRHPNDVTHQVLHPIARSGAVESTALGWPPYPGEEVDAAWGRQSPTDPSRIVG